MSRFKDPVPAQSSPDGILQLRYRICGAPPEQGVSRFKDPVPAQTALRLNRELCKIFIVNFSQHLVMAQKPFSDILCQVLKSPINAIKSRNFKVDFINESAYNKTSGA